MTIEYGKKTDALRTELRDYFWDGEFRHEVGARVMAGGKPHHPYSVFVNARTGKAGLVICNYDPQETVTVEAALEDGGTLARWRLVDDPAWRSASSIVIPPRSAAVVLPE